MRLKLGSARNNQWTCCFCIHVRTATKLLGIWHLFLHVISLIILAIMMRNPNIIRYAKPDYPENDFLPTPLSKKDDDNPYYLAKIQHDHIYPSDADMNALVTLCTLAITLLMVYGTIKGKSTHLLPFFCLQLFDFAITVLTATGYICYIRSVHRLVEEHWNNLPYRDQVLHLSPQVLSLLLLLGFLLALLWKSLCINIVWRCYKYLTLRQQAMHNTIHYMMPTVEGVERSADPDFNSILRQQDSIYGGFKQTPPPSYQDIMTEQPPPYPAAVHLEAQGHPELTQGHVTVVVAQAQATPLEVLPVEGSAVDAEQAIAEVPIRSSETVMSNENEVASPKKEVKVDAAPLYYL